MPVAGVSMLAGVSMQFSFIMPCQKWANKIAIQNSPQFVAIGNDHIAKLHT